MAVRAPIRIARALQHRNYRLFFFGQGISLIGTWLTRFATVWMVYRLTHSGALLGLVAFFGQAPSSVIAPIAGVLIDRWDRHRVVIATQVAAMLQSAALAFFAFTGLMTVWHLMVLGAVQAVINAFDMPARQSFLGQMIEDRADLPNAIALNSSMVNGARLVGPAIAAVLVGLFGEAWCFAVDAVSYVAVIVSLLMMHVPKRALVARRGHVWQDMQDGWHYVANAPLVRAVLLLLAVTSVLGGAYTTLLPMVAGSTLQGGSNTLGILMATAGCGALAGALYLAGRSTVVGLGGAIGRATLALGAALIVLRFATNVWIAAPLLFVTGAAWMIQMAATNTIIQTIVDTDKLGRVMSLYAVAFFAGMPVGALLEGWLADHLGPMNTFLCAGLAVSIAGVMYMRALPRLRLVSRPLYERLGLISAPDAPPSREQLPAAH
ncbi:MAG TPA: MFS transporter [Kofleriaceae bacterium]|nr:MFS transporter [Kofleriaceae bacterium]